MRFNIKIKKRRYYILLILCILSFLIMVISAYYNNKTKILPYVSIPVVIGLIATLGLDDIKTFENVLKNRKK